MFSGAWVHSGCQFSNDLLRSVGLSKLYGAAREKYDLKMNTTLAYAITLRKCGDEQFVECVFLEIT